MEVIILIWVIMAGVIASDQHFEAKKSVDCENVQRYDSNSIQVDLCYAKGKIESGQRDYDKAIRKTENLIK